MNKVVDHWKFSSPRVTKTKQFKYDGEDYPDLNVVPSGSGTMSLLWNEKSHAETIVVASPIFAEQKYYTEISEDEGRIKKNNWAMAKSLKPIVIETTREQYKAAAKKALENWADAFIAKAKSMKK